ncbi:MAG: AAA family ATPase [Bacilli bacterium]
MMANTVLVFKAAYINREEQEIAIFKYEETIIISELQLKKNIANTYVPILNFKNHQYDGITINGDLEVLCQFDIENSIYYRIENDELIVIETPELIEKARQAFKEEDIYKNNLDDNIDFSYDFDVPTNILKYGEILTNKLYIMDPAIGRDEELAELEACLLTPKKSPLLVGYPGVGKTAIVEGLSYRLQRGQVPACFKNFQIVSFDSSLLVAGTKYRGEFEERMKELLKSIACIKKLVVFIDEFHTLIGAGMSENTNIDVANILKPYLAEGKIKIIGATTNEEYEKIISKDKAFKRRFEIINIEESSLETTIRILDSSIKYYEQETNVKFIKNEQEKAIALAGIVSVSDEQFRIKADANYNPDLALSILAKSFAYAGIQNKSTVKMEDVVKAIRKCGRITESGKEEIAQKILTFHRNV